MTSEDKEVQRSYNIYYNSVPKGTEVFNKNKTLRIKLLSDKKCRDMIFYGEVLEDLSGGWPIGYVSDHFCSELFYEYPCNDQSLIKIKLEELSFYKEVVEVLGITQTRLELWKLLNSQEVEIIPEEYQVSTGTELEKAFYWDSSPQGFLFWERIDDKILNNYKLKENGE